MRTVPIVDHAWLLHSASLGQSGLGAYGALSLAEPLEPRHVVLRTTLRALQERREGAPASDAIERPSY